MKFSLAMVALCRQLPLGDYTAKTQYWKFEQIFPEKELRGLSPNFCIQIVCERFIQYRFPRLVCQFCCRKICGPILGIAHRHMNVVWKLGLRPRNSFSGNTQMGFSLQCSSQLAQLNQPPPPLHHVALPSTAINNRNLADLGLLFCRGTSPERYIPRAAAEKRKLKLRWETTIGYRSQKCPLAVHGGPLACHKSTPVRHKHRHKQTTHSILQTNVWI